MAIDVGAEAIPREYTFSQDYTIVGKDNPANASGTITSVEIWAESTLGNCKVGIFFLTNGNTLKCRSVAEIGGVISGAKRTIPIDPGIAVVTGDYIGLIFELGTIERDSTGFAGFWYIFSDQCIVDAEAEYLFLAGDAISLKGLGEEAPVGWTGKISGVTNPAKIMGVEVANIAKVKGVE